MLLLWRIDLKKIIWSLLICEGPCSFNYKIYVSAISQHKQFELREVIIQYILWLIAYEHSLLSKPINLLSVDISYL